MYIAYFKDGPRKGEILALPESTSHIILVAPSEPVRYQAIRNPLAPLKMKLVVYERRAQGYSHSKGHYGEFYIREE
jgi:hypothetical protein